MARPAKFDRDEAVKAVRDALWSGGYEANSIRALAEHLGITRSSLYNAFGSREALFREAVDRYMEDMPAQMLAGLPEDAPVLPVMSEVLYRVCQERGSDPAHRGCLVANSAAELCGRHEDLGPHLDAMLLDGSADYARLVRQAMTGGEVPPDADADALGDAYQALILGLSVLSKTAAGPERLWRSAKGSLKALGLYAPFPGEP